MIERKIIKRRQLIAGCGIMDTIISHSKDGLHVVRKHVVHGVKHFLRVGTAHGTQYLANRGHDLINHVQNASQNKIDTLIGHGVKPPQHSNRDLILREIQQSINPSASSHGSGIRKSRAKRYIV